MKKIALFTFALTLMLTSCSGDDSSSENNGAVLVKSFTSNDEDGNYTTNITYNGTKIVRMVDPADGYHIEFTYSGNKITRIDYFGGDEFLEERENFTYDGSGRVITYQRLDYGAEFGDYQTFVYNADNTASTELYIGDLDSQTSLNETGIVYFTNGEVTKIEKYFGSTLASTALYTYDSKNNPFKNITGYGAISYTDGEASGILHNVLTSDYNGENSTFALTYNSLDYPKNIVETDVTTSAVLSTVIVEYQ